MFRAMFSPIIRSTWLYLQYLLLFTQVTAGCQPAVTWVNNSRYCKIQSSAPNDGRKHRPKHVQLTWNNKLIYIVHLVGYLHNCSTMHGFVNVKFTHTMSNYTTSQKKKANPSHKPVPVAARSKAYICGRSGGWDHGFESHRWHGCLSVVSVVCCQVEVSATGWSLVQRSPTDCVASLCVI